jgi:hypothetical protein
MHFVYFLVGAVLVIVLVSAVYSLRHQRRLAGLTGMSEEEFVRYFSQKGVSPNVSQMVFKVFRAKANSSSFTPSPDMGLEEVFNEVPEDVDDDALYILKQLNVARIPDEVRESWSGGEIKTLDDLTMWIGWAHTASTR